MTFPKLVKWEEEGKGLNGWAHLKKGSHWGDASTRTNHNTGHGGVRREAEGGGADEHLHALGVGL